MSGLREKELRKVCKCDNCGEGVMHDGNITFWTLKVNRYGLDKSALTRQSGLEQMMGGHVGLAQVFSPDEVMAKPMQEEITVSMCESCMLDIAGISMIVFKKLRETSNDAETEA